MEIIKVKKFILKNSSFFIENEMFKFLKNFFFLINIFFIKKKKLKLGSKIRFEIKELCVLEEYVIFEEIKINFINQDTSHHDDKIFESLFK